MPVSAIYGPNGGGKSNVLEALHTVAAKVLRPLYATGDNEERVFLQKKLLIEPFVVSEEMKMNRQNLKFSSEQNWQNIDIFFM